MDRIQMGFFKALIVILSGLFASQAAAGGYGYELWGRAASKRSPQEIRKVNEQGVCLVDGNATIRLPESVSFSRESLGNVSVDCLVYKVSHSVAQIREMATGEGNGAMPAEIKLELVRIFPMFEDIFRDIGLVENVLEEKERIPYGIYWDEHTTDSWEAFVTKASKDSPRGSLGDGKFVLILVPSVAGYRYDRDDWIGPENPHLILAGSVSESEVNSMLDPILGPIDPCTYINPEILIPGCE